ncbi:MAG: InlB B-repeat-containing protein [Lentihominibacter sp.]|jgi:uncharacterized repeat protein (TIGR02543 family)
MREKLKSRWMPAVMIAVLIAGAGLLAYDGVKALTLKTSTVSGKYKTSDYQWLTRYIYDLTEDDTSMELKITDATFTNVKGPNFGIIGRYMTCTMTFDGITKKGDVPPSLIQQGAATVTIFSGKAYSWSVEKNCIERTGTLSCKTVLSSSSAWKGTSTGTEEIHIPARSKYKIVYNANGGIGGPETNSGVCMGCSSNSTAHGGKSHGIDFTLSHEKPTRDGYVFMGWATDPDALVADYQPGDSYSVNEPLTLYALWEKEIVEYYYNFWFTV